MKTTVNSIKRAALLTGCLLLSSLLPLMADDIQESLNLDYFRTPEAAAFKKYGEVPVNGYTGTADISVPLYTIKCRDIEIPIVLRYDASGIKVEQEASWVGLGWNLMVGGCVNYVCAGSTDMYGFRNVPNRDWTEYLTSVISWNNLGIYPWNDPRVTRNQTKYYNYVEGDESNWMASLPYNSSSMPPYIDQFGVSDGMRDYVEAGFSERDFYSVNVLGKSFKFFLDPFTLNIYNIGQDGEDFKVETDPVLTVRGIGHREEILKWIITDSEGYIYRFEKSDRLTDASHAWYYYTSCWYLTQIITPLGESITFSYTQKQQISRPARSESRTVSIPHVGGGTCCSNALSNGYNAVSQSATVTSHYLNKIEASNQTVTFVMSDNKECSGKRLDEIKVRPKYNDTTEVKTIRFSYGSFGYSNVGGNYSPANTQYTSENRLKLVNVKEITPQETLTTSFSYNSLNLPSKRSCAQDYWGYYNGRENSMSSGGNTLIPTPQGFMSLNFSQALSSYLINGADRFSRGNYMQAAMLNRIDYPTGGYTTYEYEPNTINTNNFTLSDIYREKLYDVSVQAGFYVSTSPYGLVTDQSEQRKDFTLTQGGTFDLLIRCDGQSSLNGKSFQVQIHRWNNQTYNLLMSFPLTFSSSQDFSLVQSVTLTAGSYFLLVIPINNNQNLPFNIISRLCGWYEGTLSSTYYTLTCGGLRIKKISNYDNDNTLLNYTAYDYNNNGRTSGLLLNKIETIDYGQCFNFSPVGGLPGEHTVDNYTMTSGHPRLPTFFASCNPGIVGYSKVTESKYDRNGGLVKSIVTSYINEEPHNVKVDYYDYFDNGQVLSQEIRDASGTLVMKTENTYSRQRIHYATNMVVQNKGLNTSGSGTEGVVNVWRYPYILSRVELSNTVTTEYCPGGGTVVKTKDYLYNAINHQVSRIDENTSISGQTRRTKITYSADGTDNISISMRNAHRLNNVVENKVVLVVNGTEKCISTRHTTYGTNFLPVTFSASVGNNALEPRSTYLYDVKKNISSVAVDGIETVYIWSYFGHYPIAKIEGLTYSQVENAVGGTVIDNLTVKKEPSETDISSLRNAVKAAGGHITTYKWKPLIGIASQKQPNDNIIYYYYDASGRLGSIKDVNQKTMKSYDYNYKQ